MNRINTEALKPAPIVLKKFDYIEQCYNLLHFCENMIFILKVYLVNSIYYNIDAVGFTLAHFGPGIGRIFVDDVFCSGSEEKLIDCYTSSSVSCSRGHSEDAGVRCQVEGLLIFLYLLV